MRNSENIKKKIPSIKILPEYFEEVLSGRKRAELRLNDRDYKKGDIYDLREWNPNTIILCSQKDRNFSSKNASQ